MRKTAPILDEKIARNCYDSNDENTTAWDDTYRNLMLKCANINAVLGQIYRRGVRL